MKIQTLFVAAVAAGAMTVVSHARDVSPADASSEKASTAQQQTFGDLMKKVLRAGDAIARTERRAGDETPRETASLEEAAEVTKASETKKTAVKVASAKSKASQQDQRPYHSLISRYAGEYGVPVSLAHAVVRLESSYRKSARGSAGEIGLMQIKPTTARGMGFRGSAEALYNPENNIKYGMKYLAKAHQLSGGDTCGTILRYNAGHGAKRMNPVSAAYCGKVKRILGQ